MEVNAALINFAAGQLSRKFLGRADLPNFYKAGALLCQNFIPQAQGPAEYRSGSKYSLHTRNNGVTSLYPFVFNDEQAYALAFSDEKLRFFSDGGPVLASASADVFTLLIHFDGADGATSYTAETGQVLTFNGDAELDTAQKEFGASSLLLDGAAGDSVSLSGSEDWNIGTGDFTIDFWVRFNSLTKEQRLFDLGKGDQGGHSGVAIHIDNSDQFIVYVASNPKLTVASGALVNTWYHVALVRTDGTMKLYLDGTDMSSGGFASNEDIRGVTEGVMIGDSFSGGTEVDGWIDEVALRKESITTTDFDVPTAAYSATGIKAITAITQANPGVITISTHGYSGGEEIYISGVGGMTELNGKYFKVVSINANTFSLTDVDGNAIDTTSYTAYTSGGTADAIYEIDTPYAAEDVDALQVAQKADLMYITHPNYEIRKLTRSGDASWTLATFTRTDDPFTKSITGATQADPCVITSNAHGFSDDDIVQIEDVGGMTDLNGNQYKVANAAANTFELTDPATGVNIDSTGYGAYTADGYVFKVGNMPRAVAFYGGRLFYGGTEDDPETFWGSKAPDNDGTTNYDVFTVGANEEDAVTFPLSSQNNTADLIQWFAGTGRFLAIGTYGGVYKANGGSDSTPISGTDIAVQPVEFLGCKRLSPVRVGRAIFYVQRGGLVLNNFAFSFLADDYKAENLNIFSDEITKSGLAQLAVQQGTEDIVWSVTNDGVLLGITVKLGEEISAWHSHKIGGTDVEVLSVCGEPQADNKDSLWIVVERTINGNTRRYMEYFEAEDLLPEPEESYTGVEATDESVYRNLLYEAQKHMVRLDSSLSLDTAQQSQLTPGAVTGTGVTFTAVESVFSASDVGKKIVKKFVTGAESGIATITGYTSAMVVTATINTDFDSTDAIASGNWYLATNSVSGLDHLEGETVAAQVDGEDDGTFTVTDGAITLNSYGTVIHVGLEYTGRLQTMPLNIGALAGTAQTRIMTVNRLGVLFRHTRGTKYGSELYRLEEIKDRDLGAISGRPAKLITEAKFFEIPSNYERRQYIHIVQDTPAPCTVQGIIPYVDTTNE